MLTSAGKAMVSEQTLPIREGSYGSRVVAIEPGGIEYIALSERHGRPIDLFWTWLSPNFEFATFFVGCISVFLFGASFVSAALGIVVGTALGALTHGLLSSWGPRLGIPQMVQSRSAFGFLGNFLPAALNTFTATVGWFLINSVSGAFALTALTGLPWNFTFAILVVAQVLVATMGHNLVHVFERYALIPLGLVFLLACAFVFAHANFNHGFSAHAPLAFGGNVGAFMLTAAAAFGYAAGWNSYASDYTRYQPPDASRFAVGFWAALGIFASCVLLELAGAALVTVAGTTWTPTDIPTAQLALAMPDMLYKATLLAIALGAVAANVINIYSGALSFLTLGLKWSLSFRRALVALLAGALSLTIGIVFSANVGPGSRYEYFLLVVGYWIAPWLGVVIADFLLRSRRFPPLTVFYERTYNPLAGPLAFLLALIISVYFFAAQALYVGPFALHYPVFGDLTFVAGFLLAFAFYALFSLLSLTRISPARA